MLATSSGGYEPFEIDRYMRQDTAGTPSASGRIDVTGPRRKERGTYPLIRSVATFPPPLGP